MCAHCAAMGGVFGSGKGTGEVQLHLCANDLHLRANENIPIALVCKSENKKPTVSKKGFKSDKSENDRFKAIRTATMGDEEIAAEVVPRSAYELQALAIHARNQA